MGIMEMIEELRGEHPDLAAAPAPPETQPQDPEVVPTSVWDYLSKDTDAISHVVEQVEKNLPLAEKMSRVSSVFALPGDIMKTYEGIKAIGDGNTFEGVIDTAIGGAGIVSDVAGVFGKNAVSDTAGMIQGSLEVGKGVGEVATAIRDGDADQGVQGASDILDGLADGLGSAPNPWVAAAGKGLGLGLAGGNIIAPWLMGGEGESAEVRQSDGEYVPSTGWCVTDWISGTGKYTDSRWDSDGERVTNEIPLAGAIEEAMKMVNGG